MNIDTSKIMIGQTKRNKQHKRELIKQAFEYNIRENKVTFDKECFNFSKK